MTSIKHFTTAAVLAIFLVLLSACASTGGKPSIVKVSPSTDAKADVVSLRVGDTLQVELDGNPTTGFIWRNDGFSDSVLEQQGDYVFVPAKDNMLGSTGKMTLTFVAKRAGAQMLNLVYQRPFEKNSKPARSFGLSVVVQ